ncbi:MAG: GerW family sporulation protein [Egibacteraceae bacterium]
MTTSARDAMTVRRVFGDPYERGGVTVIPVATVLGGAGGGKAQPEQEGGGFGLIAKPAGVYVVHGDQVRWQPAVDVNRIVAGGQLVGIISLLVLRQFLKYRARRADL